MFVYKKREVRPTKEGRIFFLGTYTDAASEIIAGYDLNSSFLCEIELLGFLKRLLNSVLS